MHILRKDMFSSITDHCVGALSQRKMNMLGIKCFYDVGEQTEVPKSTFESSQMFIDM